MRQSNLWRMEMKRRDFIKGLVMAAVAPVAVLKWFTVAVPRKVVMALKAKTYPGRVVSLEDVFEKGQWSG